MKKKQKKKVNSSEVREGGANSDSDCIIYIWELTL